MKRTLVWFFAASALGACGAEFTAKSDGTLNLSAKTLSFRAYFAGGPPSTGAPFSGTVWFDDFRIQ